MMALTPRPTAIILTYTCRVPSRSFTTDADALGLAACWAALPAAPAEDLEAEAAAQPHPMP